MVQQQVIEVVTHIASTVKKFPKRCVVLCLLDLGICSTFNVEDLTLYRGHHTDEEIEEHILSLPPTLSRSDQIEDVLDDQLVSTRRGGFQKFLVQWKNRPHLICIVAHCY